MLLRLSAKYTLLVSLLAACNLAGAQPTDSLARDPFLLGARLHYGFIIPHSRDIVNVSRSNPRGFEISAAWLLNSERRTRASGLVSKRGFVLHVMDFDNRQVLGHGISLVPFVEPMIRPWGRLYGSVQLGLGCVWLNKVYDEQTNPTNLFFSFPVSFLAMTNAYLHYRIRPRWEISAGFNYNHISNGGMKLPNKGMNFPTWNVGAQRCLQPVVIKKPVRNNDWKQETRNYAGLQFIGTLKTATATDAFPENKLCRQWGLLAMAGRRIARVSALSIGTEWIYDGYAREIMRRYAVQKSAWKGGLLLGHELLIGRVQFHVHLGAYLFNPSGDIHPVYQRYGLYYRFGRHVLAGSSLKAHLHQADVFDVRVGWLF